MSKLRSALSHLPVGARKREEEIVDPETEKGFYLIGDAGNPNYGDDLIAREWLRYLAQEHPKARVYLDSPWPGQVATRMSAEHPNVAFVDTLTRLSVENEFFDMDPAIANVAGMAGFIAAALDDEGKAARLASGIRLLNERVTSLHFIGGGYLNDKWLEKTARLSSVLWAAQHGKAVLATGMGLTPMHGDALELLCAVAPLFSVLTVRDEEGKELLEGTVDVRVMPDDCFVNGLEGVFLEGVELPDLMVCVQSDLVDDVPALHAHVLDILQAWDVEPGAKIGVVEGYPYLDYPIFETLRDAGYAPVLFPAINLLAHGFPARAGQRWISTRYHPHLLAAHAGASGVYIPVDTPYYDTKHKAALRMGSHWNRAALGEAIPQPGDGVTEPGLANVYKKSIRESVRNIY